MWMKKGALKHRSNDKRDTNATILQKNLRFILISLLIFTMFPITAEAISLAWTRPSGAQFFSTICADTLTNPADGMDLIGCYSNPPYDCQEEGIYAVTLDLPFHQLPNVMSVNAWTVDWDNVQSDCICYGRTWIADSGLFEGGTQDNCCEDDIGTEFYSTDDRYNVPPYDTLNFVEFASMGLEACCNANDCVDENNNCVPSGLVNPGDMGDLTYLTSGHNVGGDDNWAYCYAGGGEDGGASWLDCDYWPNSWCDNDLACDGGRIKAGKAGVGEYLDFGPTGTGGCCGDDFDEFFINNTAVGYGQACCDVATDLVDWNGLCQTPQPEVCDDGFDNDFDGLPDCMDIIDCGCGEWGGAGRYCNGINFTGNFSADNFTQTLVTPAGYGINDSCQMTGCLDNSLSGRPSTQYKCGSNLIGEFGVCDGPVATGECSLLNVTNFQAKIGGGFSPHCNTSVFLWGDNLTINLSFAPQDVLGWNYYVKCKMNQTQAVEFNFSSTGLGPGGDDIQLTFQLNETIYKPIDINPIVINFTCQVRTDVRQKSGWRVSDLIKLNATINATCGKNCYINRTIIPNDTINPIHTCYYCNVTNDPVDWTGFADGYRCDSSGANGICCLGNCSEQTSFYIEPGQNEDDPDGYWLTKGCISGPFAGEIACSGPDAVCINYNCSDDNVTDGAVIDLEGDYFNETGSAQCDQHTDCPVAMQGCNYGNCLCENLPTCSVDGNIYFNGDINQHNPCEYCDISLDTWNWSIKPIGSACGDWFCSDDNETYPPISTGIYAVQGMCINDSADYINCTNVSAWHCADSDIYDYGSGSQVASCLADCDSPNDTNGTDQVCNCLDTDSTGNCLYHCVFAQPCPSIVILGQQFFCGDADWVCPEHFVNSTGHHVSCSGICTDPDC